jgi:hypothetical protein
MTTFSPRQQVKPHRDSAVLIDPRRKGRTPQNERDGIFRSICSTAVALSPSLPWRGEPGLGTPSMSSHATPPNLGRKFAWNEHLKHRKWLRRKNREATIGQPTCVLCLWPNKLEDGGTQCGNADGAVSGRRRCYIGDFSVERRDGRRWQVLVARWGRTGHRK